MARTDTFSARYQRKLHSMADKIRLTSHPLIRACLAEFFGTAILIIFGCGVLAQVFLGDGGRSKHGTFISVSLGWGLAVTMGVFFGGRCGPGLINPAVTLGFAIIGRVPWKRVPLYTLAQIAGAFIGAAAVFGVYYEKIMGHANLRDNGTLLVKTTGNIFVTNPWASHATCFVDQVMGTALLAAGALAIVDSNGWKMPDYLHPFHLGLLVYTLVGCFALNAGCALNPARDLGPRLFLLVAGWGTASFTAGNYFFWIPILGPYLGAIIGCVLYELTIGIHLDRKAPGQRSDESDGDDHAVDSKLDTKNELHLLRQ